MHKRLGKEKMDEKDQEKREEVMRIARINEGLIWRIGGRRRGASLRKLYELFTFGFTLTILLPL